MNDTYNNNYKAFSIKKCGTSPFAELRIKFNIITVYSTLFRNVKDVMVCLLLIIR